MKALTSLAPIITLTVCLFYALYLAHDANLRAEHYKLLFQDASSIVSAQSHSLNDASNSLAAASGVLEQCILAVRNNR